ncbi:MAG TPA: hypothetical protein VMU09_04635 [Acidimicrobiales bacterium]|nr:hypothetical protein [Acidimicrobiales bacterium]
MSDRSPLERVLDVVVFGPTGLAITLGEEFPKLAALGRHRLEGQVHTARLVGQFAVQFGRQKVEELTGNAASKAESAVTKAAATASSTATSATTAMSRHRGRGADADEAAFAAAGASAEPVAAEPVVAEPVSSVDTPTSAGRAPAVAPPPSPAGTNGFKPGTHLAIPGYDSLSASQVVQRLDGLSGPELEEVRAHELASRRRRTILSRVEQLLAAAPPGQA